MLEKKLTAVKNAERLKEMNLNKKCEEAEEVKPTEEEKRKRREAGYAKAKATWALKRQKVAEKKEKEKEAVQAKIDEKEKKLTSVLEMRQQMALQRKLAVKQFIAMHKKKLSYYIYF